MVLCPLDTLNPADEACMLSRTASHVEVLLEASEVSLDSNDLNPVKKDLTN
jgi:hypothetical protein